MWSAPVERSDNMAKEVSKEFNEELEEVKATPKKATKESKAKEVSNEERVDIMIPRVDGEEDEIVVGVNGKMYKMKTGMVQNVPKSVAHVLELSYHQERLAIMNREAFKNQEL
jgi:hypothetical protein